MPRPQLRMACRSMPNSRARQGRPRSSVRRRPTIWIGTAQLAGQLDHLRPRFGITLPAATFLASGDLTVAGFQLSYNAGFLELGDGT